MAVTREATIVRTTSANLSSDTIAVSVGSGTGRAVIVVAHNYSGTSATTVTGVTYNGVALTAGPTATNAVSRTFSTWYGMVADGSVATPNVVLTYSAANATFQVFTASFSGLSSVRGAAANATGTSTAPTVTITTAANDEVAVLGFDGQFNGGTISVTSGGSVVASETPSSQAWQLQQTASGSSTTVNGTLTSGGAWIMGAFALVPAGLPPTITVQPQGASAPVGGTATYSLTDTGATSYQWQVSSNRGETWTNALFGSGQTTATYTTAAAAATDNGLRYRCKVSNAGGDTFSEPAWFFVSGLASDGKGRRKELSALWLRTRSRLGDVSGFGPGLLRNYRVEGPFKADRDLDAAMQRFFFEPVPPPPPPRYQVPYAPYGSARNRPGSGPLSRGKMFVRPRLPMRGAVTSVPLTVNTVPGNAVAAGAAAQIVTGLVVNTTPGNAAAAGAPAQIVVGLTVGATVGNAAAAGPTAQIVTGLVVNTTPGNAAAAGAVAQIITSAGTISTTPGNAVAAGAAAGISLGLTINATPGNAAAAGAPAQIITTSGLLVNSIPGNAVADGAPAQIIVGSVINAAPGNAVAAGSTAQIITTVQIPTVPPYITVYMWKRVS